MNLQKQTFRPLFFLFLLLCLLSGLVGVVRVPVQAAPMAQIASNVVISEFRTTGPAGASDEFVEIYNPTNSPIDISGLLIRGSNNTATVGTRYTIPASTVLQSGQHYLIVGTAYSGGTAGEVGAIFSAGTTDDGGFAITNPGPGFAPIDQVGMSLGSAYKEGPTLAPLSGTANQSYERLNTGCTDANNNAADFIWNQTTSNPQNSLSVPVPSPCLGVTNISSTMANGTYSAGAVIPIQVTFNNNVNVTGFPQLILETGSPDTPAIYSSGDGTSILTFNYTVQATDASADLDYVAANSLVLNGGTITGAVGSADLTLSAPGVSGSLAANKDIVISNGSAPSITTIKRQIPISADTNADTLTFRVTFSQTVVNVDSSDFISTGITGIPVLGINSISGSVYDVTVSGGNLATLNGNVGLDLSSGQDISNGVLPLPTTEPAPSNDEVYTVDNIAPTIRIDQAIGQLDPTSATPVIFSVVFSEPITVGAFTSADVNETGSANFITWNISLDPSDTNNTKFVLSAIAIGSNGGVTPFVDINKVTDVAGNFNVTSSTSTPPILDGTVTFTDNVPPTVNINQATLPTPQADPTNTLPIKFTVVFSEPIIASIFTPADITQNGSATGVTWSITNSSGDSKTFTLSATAVTVPGTLQPSIAANRVTDLVGNNNIASTSTDNIVFYENIRPTVTIKQAAGQADPTASLPIKFTATFSEPINVSTFTASDITLIGTITGATWTITDAGDQMNFTLSAKTVTGKGTLIPTIAINMVTDVAGNNNFPSTSTDNTVTYSGVFQTPTRLPTATPTTTPTLGIFISEVAWMGTAASSNDEWIELYNGGSTVVDLTNWTLKSTDNVINITFLATDSNHIITPGQFFILARAGTFTDVVINKEITAAFDNGGKSLQLRNNAGILIDTANSDGGSWPAGIAAPTYATMERHSGTTFDKANNWYTFAGTPKKHDRSGFLIKGTPGYANWAISVTATKLPTPTRTRTPIPTVTPIRPAYVPPPLIGINEFVPRPEHDWNNDGLVNVGDEYIEIINHGVNAVNLSGYSLDDEANVGSPPYRLPAGTLKPGERMVFYGKTTGLLLGDGGDGVRLLKPNGQLADAYNYDVVKYPDQSYCRLPDDGGLDDWSQNCFPTPGLKNSLSGNFAKPPTEEDNDQPLCPISDILPVDFAQAECPSFGNIWSRFYWDAKGWFGEKNIPNLNSKWDVYVD